jgi:putative ubiquitin-RnfH superfamily antitoxin RatB of RatAB toxin-antitoxin module
MARADPTPGPDAGAAGPAPSASATIDVEVVYCPAPGRVDCRRLRLPAGSTAGQALDASGLIARHGLDPRTIDLGVWTRACPPDTVLREHDRVEVYRPLSVDPKEARRLRYRRRAR